MFILYNFVNALAWVVNIIFFVLQCLIFVRAIISWVNPDPSNPLVQFLIRSTEPILEPIRRLLPQMGIDLSPIIAFFIIRFLQMFLVPSLYDLALRLQ